MTRGPAVLAVLCLLPLVARAATISVGPGDSYATIEQAQAGDEVVIAPGVYTFRVYLTAPAPADRPIVIRAQDPSQPPVFDLGGTLVEDAPGSYTGGDRGRGCWQISGGTHYQISGIVFTHCRNADANSAGLRYYNGANGNLVSGCVFRANDNGVTGGTEDSDLTVEFSEFDGNGNPNASSSAPTHNLYIYGGTFTLRYSYLHDPVQGQNFHLRARNATLEYNWIARGHSYEGDLMTDDDFAGGTPPYAQALLLRGNVFLQGATPENDGQIIAVYNDAGLPGLSLNLQLVHNTLVGNGGHAALVHLSNADGTTMTAELSNNIVSGSSASPVLLETAAVATVTGTNNWLPTGVAGGGLAGTVSSASPGFANAAAKDFTLAPGSPAIGAASGSVNGLPDQEYFRDETQARGYRLRATARDLGAFESTTTGAGIGPYGTPPPVSNPPSTSGTQPVAGSGCATAGGSWSLLLALPALMRPSRWRWARRAGHPSEPAT